MAEIVQYSLTDPSIHAAVLADGQPREGIYLTTYDDGSQAEAVQMLYRDGGTVRSIPIADWPAEQQALAARDAERQKHEAMNDALRSAANAHAGKQGTALTFPEMRDFLLLLMDREGLLDADGKVRVGASEAK